MPPALAASMFPKQRPLPGVGNPLITDNNTVSTIKSPIAFRLSPARSSTSSDDDVSPNGSPPGAAPAFVLSPALSPVSSRRPSLQGDDLAISCFNCDSETRANIELVRYGSPVFCVSVCLSVCCLNHILFFLFLF